MPHSLSLYCLPVSHKKGARLDAVFVCLVDYIPVNNFLVISLGDNQY